MSLFSNFCVSHQLTSLLCSLVERDMHVPHFHIFVYLSPAYYQPFVQSCRERHACVSLLSHSQSHLRINPYYFYVGRVSFIMMRSNGTFPV